MKVLAGYERDREGLSRLLASFRARSAAALAKGELSALQCGVIVDIIEESAVSCQPERRRPAAFSGGRRPAGAVGVPLTLRRRKTFPARCGRLDFK